MIAIALQVLVVVMMLSIGLELQIGQVLDGLRRSRFVAGAVVLNLVIVPVAVWAIASNSGLSAGMTTGLILLAASPAGPIGPVLSRLSQSDLGLATGLMVLLGGLGLVSTPLTVQLLIGSESQADDGVIVSMFTSLLVFQIVPLIVAIAVAAKFPEQASRASGMLGLIANVLLVGIVVALIVLRGEVLTETSLAIHAALAGGLLVVLAPLLGRSQPDSPVRALVTVTAVRNMSIALFLAAKFYADAEVEAAILIWSFWMLVVTGVVGALAGRYRTITTESPIANTSSPYVPS